MMWGAAAVEVQDLKELQVLGLDNINQKNLGFKNNKKLTGNSIQVSFLPH